LVFRKCRKQLPCPIFTRHAIGEAPDWIGRNNNKAWERVGFVGTMRSGCIVGNKILGGEESGVDGSGNCFVSVLIRVFAIVFNCVRCNPNDKMYLFTTILLTMDYNI